MTDTTGVTQNTFRFLTDLRDNNDKSWFEENRNRYEADWLGAASSFVNAVADDLHRLTPPHQSVAKINKSIRRINRDVRFSADKSPYNAQLHLVFWTGGQPNKSPALHLVFHPDRVGYGVGQWMMTPQALEAFRSAVLDKAKFKSLKSAVKKAEDVGCTLQPAELKKVPQDFEGSDEQNEFLKRKSLVCRTMDHAGAPEDFYGQAGIDRFIDIARSLAPINGWLQNL